jgi:hypothetical protein
MSAQASITYPITYAKAFVSSTANRTEYLNSRPAPLLVLAFTPQRMVSDLEREPTQTRKRPQGVFIALASFIVILGVIDWVCLMKLERNKRLSASRLNYSKKSSYLRRSLKQPSRQVISRMTQGRCAAQAMSRWLLAVQRTNQ